jgi:hypothetical protein
MVNLPIHIKGIIIGLILSDVSIIFAHWICGDVTFSHEGLLLCTDSLTIPECPRFISVSMMLNVQSDFPAKLCPFAHKASRDVY